MRVGLGDMPPYCQMIARFTEYNRDVRGEWSGFGIRDKDREWVCAHECQRSRAVFNTEVFRDVHNFSWLDSRLTTEDTEVHREIPYVPRCPLCEDAF
jgi:hypothetical protein